MYIYNKKAQNLHVLNISFTLFLNYHFAYSLFSLFVSPLPKSFFHPFFTNVFTVFLLIFSLFLLTISLTLLNTNHSCTYSDSKRHKTLSFCPNQLLPHFKKMNKLILKKKKNTSHHLFFVHVLCPLPPFFHFV